MNGEYIAKARTLDHEHSRQADGTRYPGVREQVQGGSPRRSGAGGAAGLGPGARPGGGLVPGLQQGAARPRAGGGKGDGDGEVAADRQMGVRSVHEALGIYTHDVHRRWGSVSWRSWARVIRGRLPVIGRPNADILHHGPPPAYVRARPRCCLLLAGQRRGRRCTPASCAGHARRQACERLAAGWWYRLSRPCSG